MFNVVATGDTRHSERAVKIELDKDEYGGVMHSIMVSAASSLLSDSTRYQEERQSPVSVLDQFLTEDSTSPSNAVFQSSKKQDQHIHTHIGLIEFPKTHTFRTFCSSWSTKTKAPSL